MNTYAIQALKNAREVCELKIKTEEHQAEFDCAMFGTGTLDINTINTLKGRIDDINKALDKLGA